MASHEVLAIVTAIAYGYAHSLDDGGFITAKESNGEKAKHTRIDPDGAAKG